MKEVKEMSFQELAELITQRMHLALLREGSQGMISEVYLIYNIICQWQKHNK